MRPCSVRSSRRFFPRRQTALAVLTLALVAATAYPWGSFRGVAMLKVTDTHQQIVQAAFELFLNDPRIKGLSGIPVGGSRLVWIDRVLEYEGVNGSLLTLSAYGPGPDAEGSTTYSCHWFNPSTGAGLAPQAAADWYSRFIKGVLGLGGGDEEILKGLAWSSHFLADMFVPYHLNGIPAADALARAGAGIFTLGEAEAGPAFLFEPQPPAPGGPIPGTVYGDLTRAYDNWSREGWGLNSNFRELYALFQVNHQAVGHGGGTNHLDWFDPWYWTGFPARTVVVGGYLPTDPNTDPGRSVLSTHATYESLAHGRFVQSGGYRRAFGTPPPYDPLWVNPYPDYAFSGETWRAQSLAVQNFAAKIAQRTRERTDAYWRAPETAIRAAVEAVYTMWRSAYTALQPMIVIGRDPARPNEGLVVSVNVQNHSLEDCRDVSLRLRVVKGGGVVIENVQPPSGGIAGMGARMWSWFVQIDPNQDWDVVVEAVGAYTRTPDRQHALSYATYKPDPRQPVPKNARSVETATAPDFIGLFSITDLYRPSDEYYGQVTFRVDGTFTSDEDFPKQSRNFSGKGVWKFDPATLTFSLQWQPGGEMSGTVSGNTADFQLTGRWSNGQSATARFVRIGR
ncbi:MAG: hypothetical protein GX465_13510 [Acidobacteria bacterium]|nr:hypothetical protein [Acidobacteriota bacterium]